MFCFFTTGSLKSKTKRSRFLNGLVYKTEDISVKIEDVLEESKNDINLDDTEKYHNDNSSSNNDDQKSKNDVTHFHSLILTHLHTDTAFLNAIAFLQVTMSVRP